MSNYIPLDKCLYELGWDIDSDAGYFKASFPGEDDCEDKHFWVNTADDIATIREILETDTCWVESEQGGIWANIYTKKEIDPTPTDEIPGNIRVDKVSFWVGLQKYSDGSISSRTQYYYYIYLADNSRVAFSTRSTSEFNKIRVILNARDTTQPFFYDKDYKQVFTGLLPPVKNR